MLSMNSKQCCCTWCGKSYKTRVNLDKHVILCELIHKSSKKHGSNKNSDLTDLNEIGDDLPSPKKMYQMLLELGYKYSKLEEKMEEVNKFIVKKKQKINVVEWLNSNITPSLVFENLIDQIKIIDSDIEFLFENNFLDMINGVLSRFVYNGESSNNLIPLFAFSQKANVFYAFVKLNNNNNNNNNNKNNNNLYEDKCCGVWSELSKDQLMKFLMRIQMKVSKAFCEWKTRCGRVNDDSFDIMCDKTLIKIMGNEFNQDATFNKMRGVMYNKMKTDMKAMVEYEFEF
jgi:hypothetical protein